MESEHCTIGSAVISIPFPYIPFPEFGFVCDVQFHIMKENIRILLSRKELKDIGTYISVQNDCLNFKGEVQKLHLGNNFLLYRWASDHVLYTYAELVILYRSLGYPNVTALDKLLKRTRPEEYYNEVSKAIKSLTERCDTNVELDRKPKRFK